MGHPNKHIREAIEYAELHGWRLEKAGGQAHGYGRLLCSHGHRDCLAFVHSTPRSPETHAKRLIRKVRSCPNHRGE